jgi:uncharacterized protein Yka (UPF0111/DUF47 family)
MGTASLGSLVVSLEASIAQFESDLGRAEYRMQQFGDRVEAVVDSAANAFKGIITYETLTKMNEFVQHGMDLQEQMGKLAQRTGSTVEAMAGLKFASEQADITLEQTASAAKKLANNMELHPALFAQFGITAKNSTDALVQFSNIIAGMPDGIEKIALANKVLGKSGEEMIPFLNQGGDAIAKMVERGKEIYPITAASAAAAQNYNDKLKEFKAHADTVSITLGNALLPKMTELISRMTDINNSGDKLGVVGNAIQKIFETLSIVVANVAFVMQAVGREIAAVAAQAALIAEGGLFDKATRKAVSAISAEVKAQGEQARKELDEFTARMLAPTPTPPMEITVQTGKSGRSGGHDMLQQLLGNDKSDDAVIRGLLKDYQLEAEKFQRTINAPMMSGVDKQFADMLAVVEQRASRAREELAKFYSAKETDGVMTTNHLKQLAEVDAAEKKQIDTMTRLEEQLKKNNASWEYGAKVAIRGYLDTVENVAKSMENVFTKAFKGMEDALVAFTQTGKLDISSMANSIIADLVRIQIQQNITGPLARAMGGMFGGSGAGGTGYGDTAGVAAGVPSYAGGGSTGSGVRSGGLDGMGGFLTMMHPQESVTDHTMPSSGSGSAVHVTNANTFHIDSSTDQAKIQQLVSTAVDQGNARLVDRLQRMRVL